jgi:hypothetical protein
VVAEPGEDGSFLAAQRFDRAPHFSASCCFSDEVGANGLDSNPAGPVPDPAAAPANSSESLDGEMPKMFTCSLDDVPENHRREPCNGTGRPGRAAGPETEPDG